MMGIKKLFGYTKCLLALIILMVSTSLHAQSLDDAFMFSTSGILTQKLRMSYIAENVANLTTLEDQNTGLPWQKRYVVLEPDPQGVRVVRVGKSTAPFGKYFDPAVPQSNEQGFTAYPNVNLPDEMVNLAYTENIFEANVTAYKATKAMYQNVVDMLK